MAVRVTGMRISRIAISFPFFFTDFSIRLCSTVLPRLCLIPTSSTIRWICAMALDWAFGNVFFVAFGALSIIAFRNWESVKTFVLKACWVVFSLLATFMPGRGMSSWNRKKGYYRLYLRQRPSVIMAMVVLFGETLDSLVTLRHKELRRTGQSWNIRRMCRLVFPGILVFLPTITSSSLSVSGDLHHLRPVVSATLIDPPSTRGGPKRRRLLELPVASPISSQPIDHGDIHHDVSNEVLQHVMNTGLDVSYADAIQSMNALVVESVDDDATKAPSYRRLTGEMGGLHESRAGHWKSIHIQIPGVRGMYLSEDLHQSPHYQIKIDDLPDFIKDLDRLGIRTFEASAASTNSDPVALIYYPSKSYSRLDSPFVQYGGDDATADREFRALEEELGPSKIVDWIGQGDSSVTSEDRGNPRLDFSFTPLNATDRVNPRYRGHIGPKMVTAHDERPGWISDNRSMDLSSAMVAVSKMMDQVTDSLNLPSLMDDQRRNEMFAHVIGKKSGRSDYRRNKAEGISMSISSKMLLCHLDLLNDFTPGYNWNASYYGVFPNPNFAAGNGDEPQYLRLHVGIYSRRICGTTYHKVENSSQVAQDLDFWLKEMIHSNPDRKCDCSATAVPC